MKALPVVVALTLALHATSAFAHHSFAAEYDANKHATITGSVTRVGWTNPHVRFFLDVKNADGTVTHWESPWARSTACSAAAGTSR
jgi:hypothetical protein